MVERANYGNSGQRSFVSFSFAVTHISLPRRQVVEIGAAGTQVSKHPVTFNTLWYPCFCVCFFKRTHVADVPLVKFYKVWCPKTTTAI